MKKKMIIPALVVSLCLSGCATTDKKSDEMSVATKENVKNEETKENDTYVCTDGEAHAIEVDGTEETYQNVTVKKSGDAEGDESDFYGTNAAVFATNGATLTLSGSEVTTDGKHANGVFSYGEGTVVNVSDTEINTSQANSGGIMVTGGGTLNAKNLTVTTQAGSSAPIRSDRGGGEMNVTGGTFKSYGSGSPAVYSTADINVEDATLYADVSEAVVVEGKNSVTITNSDVTGKNTTHNSDKADVYRNVMIYQSMSGDADDGKGTFTMTGGSLTSENGGMFFVTNTVAEINLENVEMKYDTDDLLRIEKAGWGNDGSNGGQVNFYANNQSLEGIVTVDDISVLNLYLQEGSAFEGSIASAGATYVELDDDSTWTLTADSEISGLTCDEDAIILNGYTLTVNGEEYVEGTESRGDAIEIKASASANKEQMSPPDGNMEMPKDGNAPDGKPEGMPEDMSSDMKDGGKPSDMNGGDQPPQIPGGNGNPPEKPNS